MLPEEESVSSPVEQVEIGRDIVERLALELTDVPLDNSSRLCMSTAYLGPRDIVCSMTGLGIKYCLVWCATVEGLANDWAQQNRVHM